MAITEGLPAAGSNIGGFMTGVAPGAGALILTVGVAKGVGTIPGAIAKGIKKRAGDKDVKRHKKKTIRTNKPRTKSLYRNPSYNTPLIPKMGPY